MSLTAALVLVIIGILLWLFVNSFIGILVIAVGLIILLIAVVDGNRSSRRL